MAITCFDRFKSARVAAALAVFNVVTVLVIGAVIYEWRQDRLEVSAMAVEFMTRPLYAPTTVRVIVGDRMSTTMIEEKTLDGGPRVLAPFDGSFRVKLYDATTKVNIHAMPVDGPRRVPYAMSQFPGGMTRTWVSYTGDDGTGWDLMEPGRKYLICTYRAAYWREYTRQLPEVCSVPFVAPGGEP